jgi:hypothetical protein
LRSYGPALIQRTQLKVRKEIQTNFMLVDSPGMIDSPKNVHASNHTYGNSMNNILRKRQSNTTGSSNSVSSTNDRGYEFPEVVRWYAERADVILLFFDPDKPGTTGETLSILTSSLIGMDHKLHIVLNKVDQFKKIHDFARAYGSLCWNLSKVIPLKDLPRIYTMCIPVKQVETGTIRTENGLGASLRDLDAMRDEVIHEVMRAPERRVDNLITNLYDSTRMLEMHAQIFEDLRTRYSKEKFQRLMLLGSCFFGGNAFALTAFLNNSTPIEFAIGISLLTFFLSSGIVWSNTNALNEFKKNLLTQENLNDLFRRRYGRQLAEGDEYVLSLWKRVLTSVQLAIETLGFDALPKLKQSELDALKQILQKDIPSLRRQSAPTDTSLAHRVAKMMMVQR